MRKKIEPYIYEIAKGLYFLSGQEEGVVKTVENPNLALRFVLGETTKKKMTSFLIGADSTVNRLPLSGTGKSSMFSTVFWAYHCTCGAHYQGIYDRFKYEKHTIPIKKCPDCGKAVEEVTWIDYGKI